MLELVWLKTWLFKDVEKIEPARSLCDYRVNVSLPIHIVRDSNAKKFEILYSFHPDRLLVEQSDNSWGGDFARGPRIISLVFVKFKAEEELRFPILVHG